MNISGTKLAASIAALLAAGQAAMALPNLTPYQPSGWSDKIVVSRTTGTTTDSTGWTTADTLYVDWAVINNGSTATASSFYTTLYVDGVAKQSWSTPPPLGVNFYAKIFDYSIGSLSAGSHTITITADSTGLIAESNESDNSYTKTITVSNPGLPNLVPYQPAGWSDKIVVSRTTGTTTDSTSLTTADTLYVDWAVGNIGTAATGSGFYNTLYVDGAVKTAPYYGASLGAGMNAATTDYSIGSLSVGTHTITITVDSGFQITESNEGDNSYTKTITVGNPSLPNLVPYQPAGWSDKIVVSRTTGTTTDSTSLTTADTLYVDWAVGNIGTAATGSGFYNTLYVDGAVKTAPYYGASLGAGMNAATTDYSIGSLSAGTHTITITVDSGFQITESNEGDNSYTKTITVGNPSLPNLVPYQPAGWSDKIVVSRTTGTTTDSTSLTTADTLYVDWAVGNIGTAATGSGFYNTLYVDGAVKTAPYYGASLGAGMNAATTDYSIGSLSAGTHTITITVDSGFQITESNEGDNSYTKTITVGNPSLPNLVPYQPAGWSDKIVVSRTTGTTTDSTSLTTADTLYVDWAVGNIGTAATGSGFYNTLYVDGAVKTAPYYGASLGAGMNAATTDYSIGSLSAGTHTIMITVDSGFQIAESNESDNSYTKTITVGAASAPNLTPYAPSGWSDKIVVSRATGNNTDSTGLTIGDSLYVDWAVLNNGNAAAASLFYTELYLDGVLKQTWSTPPPLNANYYAPVFDYPIGSLSAGTHTLRIKTDSTGAISESNESDNEYTKTITVGSTSLPDFVITSISLSPSSPQLGQAYTAYVTVQNQGSGSGAANWLDVWANQPSSQSCGANGDTWANVGVLTAGQSKTFTFGMAAPASSGSYTFRAFVDSACQTTESNDSNNQSTLAYTVSQAGQLPDFLVTAISLSPSSPQPGQAVTAYVTVKNQGTVAGDAGWLDVWANQSSAPACGASGNIWAAVGTLSAAQSKTISLSLAAPASAGSYTCRAFVDSACQTPESAEGNNQTTLAYTVGAASALPDFVVTSISFNPAQPIAGQPFTAYVTVKNQGAGPGDARWLDVWVNQPSAQSCGASGDQHQSVGTLAAGQSTIITFNLTTPASGAPWTFRAFVDSGCQTAETSDANNQTTASYGVNPVAQPDFLITSISLSPSSLKPGDTFTAYITVKNQGSGPGDGGWLDVWANKPTAASCGDSGDSYATVGVLAAGQTKVIPVANLTAASAGNNTLRAFVDSTCQTTETSDANNQTTFNYSTSQKVLLLLHGMNASPTTWDDYVDRFNGSAPIISGGINVSGSNPAPDANGVLCYRVDFGWYEINGPRTGVEGVTAGGYEKHGDFSTFAQLGQEVWDAVHYILSIYPGAQVTLVGHSRGGLAARAFLQTSGSSPEKSSVAALLTTGTPHKGSRLGRIYSYLADPAHSRATSSGNYWQADWDVANTVLNSSGLDVRFPTINDLSDNSAEVAAVNAAIGNLPTSVNYGAITYTGVEIGLLARNVYWNGIQTWFDYSIFANATQTYSWVGPKVSSQANQAEDYILGSGNTPMNYLGDGIVPLPSQRYDDITGFPATKLPPFAHSGTTIHTEETGQEAHISDALKTLINW